MISLYKLFLIAIFLNFQIKAQDIKIIKSFVLNEELREISGLVSLDGGLSYFAINDGGNKNQVYHLDSTGAILRRITVKNASNTDWEDLSTDFMNYLYIADTGDNKRQRQGLSIYRIGIVQLMEEDSLDAEITEIRPIPQTISKKRNRHPGYDIEAVCWRRDSLWLFSKHWKMSHKPVTHVFCLPALPGVYTPAPRASVSYTDRFFLESQLTGACKSAGTEDIYWLSGTQIYEVNLASDIPQIVDSYDFGFLSQKESICSIGGRRFAVAQESNKQMRQEAMLHIVEIPEPGR